MIRSTLRYFAWRLNLCLPGNRLYGLRTRIWRGVGFNVHPTARIMNCARLIYGDISIGENTFIGAETMITGGNVEIGKNCDLAPRVIIHVGSHEIGPSDQRAGKCLTGSVKIGDGTWIGVASTIIDGAEIGKGCVVAAGSLVKDKFPDNVLIAGVPAAIKKQLSQHCPLSSRA